MPSSPRLNAIRRRQFCASTLAALSACVSAGPAVAAAVDLDHPQGVLDTLVRLRGSHSPRPTFWWLTETVYGVVGDRITPLHMGHVGTVVRTVPNGDGSATLTQLETVFWTALDGVTELTTLKNPYTGADNPLTPLVMGPHSVRLTTKGTEAPQQAPGGTMAFASSLGPVVQVGDDIFISSDVMAAVTFEDPGKPQRTVNDLSTYQGRLSDLERASGGFVPAWVTMQSVSSWTSAMDMGGREGHLVSRAAGAKVESIDLMPTLWRTFAARHSPHILKDPESALAAAPAKLG
jgi:hypothetical protein